MSTFLSNRDGGLTNEEGHYRFQTNVWDGEVIGNGLEVTENSPLGMSVLVNGGDAKVPYLDYAYTVWIPDASPEVATITTADPTNPRIDRVVLYVDRAESPQQVTPNNPGIPKIAVVAGTPGAVPVRPNDAAVDTAVSNQPWIDLADVLVGSGVTQITDANITDTRVPVTSAATGGVVQFRSLNSTAVATGSTQIPLDDTIPQITEGDQYMTLTITPKSATNNLKIEVKAFLSNATAGRVLIGALFQNSTANALAATAEFQDTASGRLLLTLTHTMTAGTTSEITFRFRAGAHSTGTTTFNGSGGARLFGAITKSSMVITEYKA